MRFDVPEIFHIGDIVKVPVLGYLCRGVLVSIREDDIAEVEINTKKNIIQKFTNWMKSKKKHKEE